MVVVRSEPVYFGILLCVWLLSGNNDCQANHLAVNWGESVTNILVLQLCTLKPLFRIERSNNCAQFRFF